jgi:hypothetical protein
MPLRMTEDTGMYGYGNTEVRRYAAVIGQGTDEAKQAQWASKRTMTGRPEGECN